MNNDLVLATSNPGKIQELQALLAPLHCISQASLGVRDAAETGLSFIENALIKARHASLCTGKPALADDSGLVVPALQGAPGIYSARYAGPDASDEENVQLLLDTMRGLEGEARSAYFYCALALMQHAKDPRPIVVTGQVLGFISTKPQGNQGFGYDPIFYLPEFQCTMAELSQTVKNTISHRAQALTALRLELG